MNYDEAMSFLKGTEKYGSRLGLDSIRSLMRELGDVQERIPIVHIAGTNGKGSVGAMLSAVLVESGYRVGRFNTPDVFSYEEEFLLNGVSIEKERLALLFTEVRTACERMTEQGLPHPTRFEAETAAAFLWFYQENCDIAIAEAGMGGETDATNLIRKPLVSVLTSISMDHMRFLGNTLPEIAAVKAGIIKHSCPVVCAPQEPEVMDIIREKCRREEAELFPADERPAADPECVRGEISFLWDLSAVDDRDAGRPDDRIAGRPDDGNAGRPDDRITLGLRGSFQTENAVCALRVLEVIKKRYPRISRSSVLSGLRRTRCPGRFEQVASSPDVYLDGAHNEDAVSKLRETLDLYFPGRRKIFIMGVLADKEYEKMIRIMFREGDPVFTVTPPNPRALSAEELARQLKEQEIDAVPCANSRDAVSYALAKADEEDVILAFGSFSYLNEVKKAVQSYRAWMETSGQ